MFLLEHVFPSVTVCTEQNNSLGLQALEGWEMLKVQSAERRDDICPAISHMRWWKCMSSHILQHKHWNVYSKFLVKILGSELCFPFFPLLRVTWEVGYVKVALTAISDLFNSSMKGTWKEAVAIKVVTMNTSIYCALSPSCWGAKKCLPIIAAFNQSFS